MTTMSAPRRGVAYVRQSVTRSGSESLAGQDEALRAAAERLGVELVDVIVEPPSTSAYKNRGRDRPRWNELLELVRSGRVDVVLAYASDRLSRGGGPGWAPLLEAAEAGGLDPDAFVLTPMGPVSEFEIGLRAAMDRESSRKTAALVTESHARRAAKGLPVGGPIPFGWRRGPDGGRELDPGEAAAVRDAAARLLAGESLRAIALDWNARGIRTRRGNQWDGMALRQLLAHPRLAGQRAHNGRVVAVATWPAVLDEDTAAAVSALLRDPARRIGGSRARKYLLAGMVRCGGCGRVLHCRVADRNHGRRYICRPEPNGGCGRISIAADDLERTVVARVLRRLDSPALVAARRRATDRGSDGARVRAEVAALEARLAQLGVDHADGLLGRTEFVAATQRVRVRLERLERTLAVDQDRHLLDRFVGQGARLGAEWEQLGLVERRAAITAAAESITVVGRLRAGRPVYDPRRVKIRWRR